MGETKKKTYFETLSDEEFFHVLEEFENWTHNGVIPAGSVLEKVRDEYEEKHGAQGIILLQFELLFVCARRLKVIMQDQLYGKG